MKWSLLATVAFLEDRELMENVSLQEWGEHSHLPQHRWEHSAGANRPRLLSSRVGKFAPLPHYA